MREFVFVLVAAFVGVGFAYVTRSPQAFAQAAAPAGDSKALKKTGGTMTGDIRLKTHPSSYSGSEVAGIGPEGESASPTTYRLIFRNASADFGSTMMYTTSGGSYVFNMNAINGIAFARSLTMEGSNITLDTGALRLGRVATGSLPTCDSTRTGSLMYDTTTNEVKFCNGSAWGAL